MFFHSQFSIFNFPFKKKFSPLVVVVVVLLLQLSSSVCMAQGLEIPSRLNDRKEQIIKHLGFTVSYNEKLLIPNWVAYKLTREMVRGTVKRTGDFIPDPLVRGGSATKYDYSYSGYDRGHMAPAGDMKWNRQAMIESFYLSNICPQNNNLNGGDWRILEEKVRSWAEQYGTIYVVCGPVMADKYKTIGENRVAVPAGFFKVLLRKTHNGYTAIGYFMKNEAGHKKLFTYAMSVSDIEILTGIDFFPSLPNRIEKEVEERFYLTDWR